MAKITRFEYYKQEKGTMAMDKLIQKYDFKIENMDLDQLLGILVIEKGMEPRVVVNASLHNKYQKLAIVYAILVYKQIRNYTAIPQRIYLNSNELDPSIYKMAVDILLPDHTFRGKYLEWINDQNAVHTLGNYFTVPDEVVRAKIKMKG